MAFLLQHNRISPITVAYTYVDLSVSSIDMIEVISILGSLKSSKDT